MVSPSSPPPSSSSSSAGGLAVIARPGHPLPRHHVRTIELFSNELFAGNVCNMFLGPGQADHVRRRIRRQVRPRRGATAAATTTATTVAAAAAPQEPLPAEDGLQQVLAAPPLRVEAVRRLHGHGVPVQLQGGLGHLAGGRSKTMVKVSKQTRNTRRHPAADISTSYCMLALEFLSEFPYCVTVLSSFRVAVNSIEFSYEFLSRNRACSATSATSCSRTATPSLTSTCRRWSTCTSCTTRWQRSSTPTSYTGEQAGVFCLPIEKN